MLPAKGNFMRVNLIAFALGLLMLGLYANVSTPDEQVTPATGGQSRVMREEVDGPFRFGGKLTKISGKVTVLDAHTLQFEDGTEVELNGGMDAPDLEQKGITGKSFYPCGKQARDFLAKLIGDQKVVGYDAETKQDGKLHGSFFVGEKSIEIEMVRNGWAISHHSGMEGWEIIARENKRGLFRDKFIAPERWRKGERLKGE
jgi:endonuclease YncB( thermonuclease family)